MTKEGIVSKTENGYATVLVKTQNACDVCRAECGGHCDKAKLEKITTENKIGAVAGDRVVLYSETKTVMLWACLVFVLPIILCFATVVTASLYTSNALILTLIGIATFFEIFVVLRFAFRNKKESDVFEITQIIKESDNKENS